MEDTEKIATTGRKKKKLHCPECGGVVGAAGKGTNGEFYCPRCRMCVDLDYTGLTLSMNMVFKETDD